jgi:hypothetical protein
MSTLTLPAKAKPLILVSAGLLAITAYAMGRHGGASLALFALAFLVSGLVGDAFTGLAHFGFDYVFPYRLPILGPIAREFNEHHRNPRLDPSSYVENFTKGAYASLPFAALSLILLLGPAPSGLSFFASALLFWLAIWAGFFHQIHAYCHTGSRLPADLFNRRIAEIGRIPAKRQRMRELRLLFATVPIPPVIRLLQRCGLILRPESHNLHHIGFEADFSSVNGWSDPILNPILGPIARRYKEARRKGSLAGTTHHALPIR